VLSHLILHRIENAYRRKKSVTAGAGVFLTSMPAADSASRNTVFLQTLSGMGRQSPRGWGLMPTGKLPERVTKTEPSGFVAISGGSKDGLVARRRGGQVIHEFDVRSLRRGLESGGLAGLRAPASR